MSFNIDEILNYSVLTEPVNKIMTELPKVLPQEFYTRSRDVLGDRFRRVTFRGTRQPATIAPYGSPPRQVLQTAIGTEELVMLHSIEEINAGPEVLKLFHGYSDYTVQISAIDELNRRAEDFARRQDNLMTTAIHCALAFGKLWFDANGNIQTSSGGADIEIDYRVPSGNRFAFGTSWADPTSDIPTMVLNFMSTALRATGRKPKMAIYGKNVAGYLARNTSFAQYLARNYGSPGVQEAYIKSGQIPNGVLDLNWVPAQDAYFLDSSNTAQEIFPADQITFVPDLASGVYELKKGSYAVPKTFGMLQQGADFGTLVKSVFENPVYGPFRYAYGLAYPTPQLKIVQGNTFLPDFLVAEAFYYADTTP